MRKFSSYGPVSTATNYYAPRTELIEQACLKLLGEKPDEGGHYITVWAPRQTGKTWLLIEVVQRLKVSGDYDVMILSMQSAKHSKSAESVLEILIDGLRYYFPNADIPYVSEWKELQKIFTSNYFTKPLILILDEFDAMPAEYVNAFANEFRVIYTERRNEPNKTSTEKRFKLHGLALVGVRSVLGVDNVTGSPFNVQHSVHVPNLTKDEVAAMFRWYEKESGQGIEAEVIDRLFYETQGQPGLVSWFGELLTETYNRHESVIKSDDFDVVFSAALNILPNNNVLNIISKANTEPYREVVLKLFDTNQKVPFRYDNRQLNYLFLNGVIEPEVEEDNSHSSRFANPFVQKRLFHFFADELTPSLGRLYDPFDDMSDAITDSSISVYGLMHRYEAYLQQNRARILEDAPRRETDHRVVEAIFHFNLYTWLYRFMDDFDGRVTPEFPTGNGKIDLLVDYSGNRYGIELKSFVNHKKYREALEQAAKYGKQLKLLEIWLVLFVEIVDDKNREKFETTYKDSETGVAVHPVLVVTG